MFLFLFLLLWGLEPVTGLLLAQRMLRSILRLHPPNQNPFVALIETPLAHHLVAYTANDQSRIYLDSRQLEQTPNTLWNVLRHEVAHTQGQQHGQNTTEMQYYVTKNPQGTIVEDTFRI